MRGCGDPAPHRQRHSLTEGVSSSCRQGVNSECRLTPGGSICRRNGRRLYLPEEWAHDGGRRRKAGVPEGVELATKPAIALAQIEAALQAGVPKGVVLAAAAYGAAYRAGYGAGYGADMKFQARLAELGLDFVLGVQPRAKIWIDGHQPLPPEPWPE